MGVKRLASLLPGDTGGQFSEQTVFHLLRNQRRRYALHYLKREQAPVEMGDLVDQVAAWENGTTPDAVDDDERQRVYVSLFQSHLPRMEERGIVRIDEESRTISLTDAAAGIDVYVDVVPAEDLRWSEYYLALSGLCGAFLAVVWLDVYPFVEVADAVWLQLIAALYLVSALVHYRYQRRHRLGTTGPPPEYEA